MRELQVAALFFDFDGVLVESTEIKRSAMRELFNAYGGDVVEQVLEHHRRHGGISRVAKIKYAHEHIIGKPLSKEELELWAEKFSRLVVEKVVAADWVSGARKFLDEASFQIPVFVISGTPQAELELVLRRRKMSGYFREILGSPTRKPDHIRRLLTRYQLDAGRCVFIGDALTDYHAARETGLAFVGIRREVEFPDEVVVLPDCTMLKDAIMNLFSARSNRQ